MSENDCKTVLARTEIANHLVLHTPPSDVWEAFRANFGETGTVLTTSATCIKLGQGGYGIHDVDGDVELRELPGAIIVDWHDVRHLYARPLEEGGGAKPDCYSDGAVVGIGAPGGSCEACEYSQWGSARNGAAQACKKNRILYILREHNLLPEPLKLPPTSIAAAVEYFIKLSMRGLPHYGVVTLIGTERTKNAAGITYLKATFTLAHRLPSEQCQLMREYSLKFRARRQARNGGEPPPDWVTGE